jgi:DNA-binding IclR family transcriptional regulator
VSDKRSSSSVQRAFELLDQVAGAGDQGITLSDLARKTQMSVSTCHRYVTTLLDLRALNKDSAGHLFPGVRLVTLSHAWLERNTLRNVARSELEELAALTGETVHLGMHADQGVVYIDKIDSAKAVRLVSRIGALVPHYCSAMGKSILATMTPAEREPYLTDTKPLTPTTLTGAALIAELDLIAKRRWAIDEQENEDGVRCVGAAITSRSGELLGAISISGPAARFSREMCTELAEQVLAAADRIGQGMP